MDRPYKTYDVRMARQRGHPHVHVVERCPQCYAQRSSRVAPEENLTQSSRKMEQGILQSRRDPKCSGPESHQVRSKHWTTRNHHGRRQVELELHAAATRRRRQTGTSSYDVGSRVPTPERRKPRFFRLMDELESNTRRSKATSHASDHVLVPVQKVATHDLPADKPAMRIMSAR